MLDGDPAPPQKTEHSPQFSVHVYCGQTAGWIKMPLGTNVGLGPCHIVLDWNPSPPPPERGTAAPPLFSAHVYCGHGRPSQLLLSSLLHAFVCTKILHVCCILFAGKPQRFRGQIHDEALYKSTTTCVLYYCNILE